MFQKHVLPKVIQKIKSYHWYRHGVYNNNLITSSFIVPHLGDEWFNKEGHEKGISNLILIGPEAHMVQVEYNKMRELVLAKMGNRFLREYVKGHSDDNIRVMNVARKIGKKDYSSSSHKELKKDLIKFFDASKELIHWLWSMEYLNAAVDIYVKKNIGEWKPQWNDEDINHFLGQVSFIPKKLAFQRESEEILSLKKISNKEIALLHSKYAWLNSNIWNGPALTLTEYKQRVKTLVWNKDNIRRRIIENNNQIKNAQQIILGIKNKEIKDLLIILQELIYLKTDRIDVFTESWNTIKNLIEHICLRLHIQYDDIQKMHYVEILEGLDEGKIKITDFAEREKFACMRLDNTTYFYYGEECNKIQKALTQGEDYSAIKEIRGNIAYKGMAIGPARVIMNDKDIYRVKKGDILICNLTNPNYDPVFGKIKAVVTEEGGLLCHSAIMAREFRIPCIVGTKIATKVFKNGEIVEVDAEKGIVRKVL